MIEFKGCTIAVPLPENVSEEYRRILRRIGPLLPDLETAEGLNSAINIHFLGYQDERQLPETLNFIRTNKPKSKGEVIKLKGMGILEEMPSELYLSATLPQSLIEFRDLIKKNLPGDLNEIDAPFNPRLTITDIKYPRTLKWLKSPQSFRLKRILNEVDWDFPLTKLSIYGKKLTPRSQYAEIDSVYI